jgi:hypothetical protein
MPYKRDYQKENEYKSKPDQIKKRVMRNAARRKLEREGLVSKGDGKTVGHIKALSKGGGNHRGNLRVESSSSNYSFARNKDGSMKSEKSKREKKK